MSGTILEGSPPEPGASTLATRRWVRAEARRAPRRLGASSSFFEEEDVGFDVESPTGQFPRRLDGRIFPSTFSSQMATGVMTSVTI